MEPGLVGREEFGELFGAGFGETDSHDDGALVS